MTRPRNPDQPTAVYRLYDSADALLYIGIAIVPRRRWAFHAYTKPWWPQVKRATVQWWPNFTEARRREAAAIRVEQPRHNVTHHPVNGPTTRDIARRRAMATHAKKRNAARFLGLRSAVSGEDGQIAAYVAHLTRPLLLPWLPKPKKGSYTTYRTERDR